MRWKQDNKNDVKAQPHLPEFCRMRNSGFNLTIFFYHLIPFRLIFKPTISLIEVALLRLEVQ